MLSLVISILKDNIHNVIIGIAFLFLILYVAFVSNRYESLKQQYTKSKIEYEFIIQQLKDEQDKLKTTLNLQNNHIQEYELNVSNYKEVVNKQNKELELTKNKLTTQIQKELSEDSSSDKQLQIVNKLLQDFSNASN